MQTQDEIGQPIEGWETLDTINAKVEGIQGREFLSSAAEHNATTWRVTMRYRDDFDTSARLVDGCTAYNIKAILPDNKRRQLVLMCESGLLGV